MQAIPRFTIVVPTRNRPRDLSTCLRSLAALDYPRDAYQVVVVVDGSGEPDESTVRETAGEMSLHIEVRPSAGPAAARNTGAKLGDGELLAFTDDDCRPAPDWLSALASTFRSTACDAVGGRTVNVLDNPYSIASQLVSEYLCQHYNREPDTALVFASNNLAIRAEAFWRAGGFDESYALPAAEDRDACDRWRRLSFKMVYDSEAVVQHAHELSLRRFWRQHSNYGRGAFVYHQRSVAGPRENGGLEEVGFYTRLLAFPFREEDGYRAWRSGALVALSQVATAAGYFQESMKRKSHGGQPHGREERQVRKG
jgi:GT2 family glycosyltransferase